MTAQILVACSPGERRVALINDGVLMEYALDRPGAPDGVGDLHLGRLTANLPALGGAFMALHGPNALPGFLPEQEGAAGKTEGDLIAVRVSRAAQGKKGPRLTARLTEAERLSIPPEMKVQMLLRRGAGPAQRLALVEPEAAILCDDPGVAAELHGSFGKRVGLVERCFDDEREAEIDALAHTDIALPGGMSASIHPTPALVAIDMDGGSSSAERRPKQVVQFAANRTAIGSLLHQLRLRNLSGAILIDLAGLAARKRAALGPEIERALARDPLQPRLLGFTALGLAEITRPRVHPPLHELQSSPHGIGLAALRAALAARPPAGSGPVRMRGGLAVITALRADPTALSDFAQRAAAPISLVMDLSVPNLFWTIEHD